jgi:hypothetical protein
MEEKAAAFLPLIPHRSAKAIAMAGMPKPAQSDL